MATDIGKLSIGAKLTLRYTAALTVTITVAALVVYTQVASRINREATLLIEVEGRGLADQFREQAAHDSSGAAAQWLKSRMGPIVGQIESDLDLGVDLIDRDGRTLLASGSLHRTPPPVSHHMLNGSREEFVRAVNVGGLHPYLLYATQVPGGVLRTMISTRRYAGNIQQIRDVFLLSLPIVLVFTALLGWLLARGSLYPIAQMTATARSIDGEDTNTYVPRSNSGDELDSLAETLNGMLDRIRGSVLRMRRFNANAAHELRTPLTAISNEVEVTLERERTSDEYRVVLEDVLLRVHQMASGVEGMLRLSQFEAGLPVELRQPVDLAAVIDTVREFFDPLAADKGIELRGEYHSPLVVNGEPSWLHQLFSNLVSNALKHAPPQSRVEIRVDKVGEWIETRVSDRGPGIPQDQRGKIFERFERGTAGEHGYGLGLPIALEIARAHGGQLELEPAENKGATFLVRLPLVREPTL